MLPKISDLFLHAYPGYSFGFPQPPFPGGPNFRKHPYACFVFVRCSSVRLFWPVASFHLSVAPPGTSQKPSVGWTFSTCVVQGASNLWRQIHQVAERGLGLEPLDLKEMSLSGNAPDSFRKRGRMAACRPQARAHEWHMQMRVLNFAPAQSSAADMVCFGAWLLLVRVSGEASFELSLAGRCLGAAFAAPLGSQSHWD